MQSARKGGKGIQNQTFKCLPIWKEGMIGADVEPEWKEI